MSDDQHSAAEKYRALQAAILIRAKERGELAARLARGKPIDASAELAHMPVEEAAALRQSVEDAATVERLLASLELPPPDGEQDQE